MTLKNLIQAATILSIYCPDATIAAEHDLLYLADVDQQIFLTIPTEVIAQLDELGVHYDETWGWKCYC